MFDTPEGQNHHADMTRLGTAASAVSAVPAVLAVVLALTGAQAMLPRSAAATTADEERAAEAVVASAKARYLAGDFDAAARLYMEAYGKVQRPATLFNAARAYEQAGQWAEAKPLFELYLQVDRGDDADSVAGRADAERHLAAIRAKLALPRPPAVAPAVAAPVPPPVAVPVVPRSPVIRDPPAVDPPRRLEEVRAPPALADGPSESEWGPQKVAGISLAVGGSALIVTSVVLAVVANARLADLDARLAADALTPRPNLTLHPSVTQREMDEGLAAYNARQVTAGILGAVGGVCVVTGGILLWRDAAQERRPRGVAFGIAPQPSGAAWTVSGRF